MSLISLSFLALLACDGPSEPAKEAPAKGGPVAKDKAPEGASKEAVAAKPGVTPQPLPNPNVPGYSYPEAEATILAKVNAGDQAWIDTHGWGLWTALTMPATGVPGQLVYETWLTPDEVKAGASVAFRDAQRIPHPLTRPRQFTHGGPAAIESTPGARATTNPAGNTSDDVVVTVNWSPEMATDVATNKLLDPATLAGMVQAGTTSVTLVSTSVSLKPTYLWMGASQLTDGKYYRMQTWKGGPNKPAPFPSQAWGSCVWIDTTVAGVGTGDGSADSTCADDGSSRTPATTYGKGAFIGFALSAAEATAFQGQQPDAKAGDPVVLAAMHVGTREMTEWTWQSYWWQPGADAPPAPSSTATAQLRPAQLTGAARNYAMCTAYQMVAPNQPTTGGVGTAPVYCYNPYLEASFTPQILSDSKKWSYEGVSYDPDVGVETNCMSCHVQAAWFADSSKEPAYTADQYISLDDPEFTGGLRMDFSWSILGNLKSAAVAAPK